MDEEIEKFFNELGKEMFPDMTFSDFMNEPICTIKFSRRRTSVTLQHILNSEIDNMCAQLISTVLDMVPEERRNNILFRAIQRSQTKEGMINEANEQK